jgi:hypothetical protein
MGMLPSAAVYVWVPTHQKKGLTAAVVWEQLSTSLSDTLLLTRSGRFPPVDPCERLDPALAVMTAAAVRVAMFTAVRVVMFSAVRDGQVKA